MFKFEVKDIKDGRVEKVSEKFLYDLDKTNKASDWVREPVPKRGGSHDYVKLSSGIKVKQTGAGTILPNSLGYFYNDSNCIERNSISVALFSTAFSSGHGVSVKSENYDRAVSLFSARKLIASNWLNGKDEYLAPDIAHDKYDEYQLDSVVYSTFHSSSNQSSLRQVEYKESLHDVKNEFFFILKDKMQKMADAYSNTPCYTDIRHDKDRFVALLIKDIEDSQEDSFSTEAQLVLDLARDLVVESFGFRTEFNKVKPEYQINNWDCGWYQVKGLLNWICEHNKSVEIENKYVEFKQAYNALADKMRPMVYELGFLKK